MSTINKALNSYRSCTGAGHGLEMDALKREALRE